MKMMSRARCTRGWSRALAAAFVLGSLVGSVSSAHAADRVRFVLNWKPEGTNAPFYMAAERGYFTHEGLDVVLDAGDGSAAVTPRIAGGAYDAGFGDINAMMRFDMEHPDHRQTAVLVIYNRSPLVIVSLARTGIRKPADLMGRVLGAADNEASFQMLPTFAAATGIDVTRIKRLAIAPKVRDVMLLKGQIDAAPGYDATAWFGLRELGLMDADLSLMYYSDYGIDLYSNSVIVAQEYIDRSPKAVAGLVRAIVRAWMEAIADPHAAIETLAHHEPLINKQLEEERLRWTIEKEIRTDETHAGGFGAVDRPRFDRAAALIQQTFKLADRPTADRVYTDRFLPAAGERPMH